MKEAVLARQELDDGAEVEQALDRAFVDLADFDLGRDDLDAAAGFFNAGRVRAGDGDRAVVFDVDRRAGFFGEGADGGAALAVTSRILSIDLEGDHARGEVGEFLGAARRPFPASCRGCAGGLRGPEPGRPA